MQCPECDIQLAEVVKLDIHLDLCAGCRGIWFDSGELETYRQRVVGGRVLSVLEFVRDPESPACTCPGCGQRTLVAGKLGNLRLDKCGNCRGVFVPATTIDTFKPKSTTAVVADAGIEGAVSFGVESLGEVLSWLIQGLVDGL
ncbi:MAG: zf-TFIIB domain-containing protein [Woeseiaceae bacterium]|nr:zf-TFIIB domain-containing protein [Woeseiaceae bacterium]